MVCLPKQCTKNSVGSHDFTVSDRRYNWLGFGSIHVKKSTCVTNDSRSSGSSVGMNGLCFARGYSRFIVNNPNFVTRLLLCLLFWASDGDCQLYRLWVKAVTFTPGMDFECAGMRDWLVCRLSIFEYLTEFVGDVDKDNLFLTLQRRNWSAFCN